MSLSIGVLFGGPSTEHRISCLSAMNIVRGLRDAGYRVAVVGITLDGVWLPYRLPIEHLADPDWAEAARERLAADPPAGPAGPGWSPAATVEALFSEAVDVIWPAVHGINCEDGVLQGFLEMTGLPYVGSGVLGSAVGMDKIVTKMQCEAAGIPVTPWLRISRAMIAAAAEAVAAGERPELWARIEDTLGYPCFLKPANGGSSVGTYVVNTEAELADALDACAGYDPVVLVERFIPARELEVAVLGNDTLVVSPVGEVVKADSITYYDYEAKYLSDSESSLAIPADIPDAVRDLITEHAAEVYRLIGCAGMARVDFFYDTVDGQVYLNEINTLPGFTAISLYPVAMTEALGDPNRMYRRMIELAIERHRRSVRRLNITKED